MLDSPAHRMPVISVIIPNYNGVRYISSCLSCFREQTLAPELFEIVVVDNGSTDNSWELLQKYSSRIPNLHLAVESTVQSSYAARNLGVQVARGKLLAFTDIDCLPRQDWLERAFRYTSEQWSNTIVSGLVEMRYHGARPNIYELVDKYSSLRQETYAQSNYGATANLLVPQRVMRELGGFDVVVSGGDQVFCRKAVAAGFDFEFAEDIVVFHPARDSFREVMAKARRLGKGVRQSIPLMRPKTSDQLLFAVRQFVGMFIPRHQFRTMRDILMRENLTGSEVVKLWMVVYIEGFIQRFYCLWAWLMEEAEPSHEAVSERSPVERT